MRPIDRTEVLGLADYEIIRERFRARVIAEKKKRRVALGPKATAVFENRDTVLLQIQEMLRTERITRTAAIQHEIDTYNENVPRDGELSCTVMIEIVDRDEREAFLRAAAGLERHLAIAFGGSRVLAVPTVREGLETDRTTAVHYLKFPLPRALAETLRAVRDPAKAPAMALVVDHPAYAAEAALPAGMVVELAEDLRE